MKTTTIRTGTAALALVAATCAAEPLSGLYGAAAVTQVAGAQPGPGGGYDCHQDSVLDRARALPAADTAGLNAEVARNFPGWRPSTEREIACRFPLADGSRPQQYWPGWGSGRAWWIWRGDFDGDRLPDRLVLLTRTDDPARDLLVVFFGNGSALRVAEPGGWGVEVSPRERTITTGAGVVVHPRGDGITIVFWEKAAELHYWDGHRFRSISLGD